jgi:hypothetical protein
LPNNAILEPTAAKDALTAKNAVKNMPTKKARHNGTLNVSASHLTGHGVFVVKYVQHSADEHTAGE